MLVPFSAAPVPVYIRGDLGADYDGMGLWMMITTTARPSTSASRRKNGPPGFSRTTSRPCSRPSCQR
eukprot:436999-Pyramimonas_sp.AAC.1